MRNYILIALLLLFPGAAFADGTDAYGNYVAGTGAGSSLETDATGSKANGNTFVGTGAGYSDSTGNANTAFGFQALAGMTSGIGNVGIGYMAGDSLTASSHKLFINTRFYPAYGIFGDFSTGYFGINKVPTRAFDVTGTIGADSVQVDVGKFDELLFKRNIIDTDGNVNFTAAQSGSFRSIYLVGQLVADTLCAAAAGVTFDFFVSDTDSGVICAVGNDKILDGVTPNTRTSTVAGSITLTGVSDSVWAVTNKTGTWAAYDN